MAVILLSCKDLLMENVDLAFQLLPADGPVTAGFPESIHVLIKFFQGFFQAFVFIPGATVGLLGFF